MLLTCWFIRINNPIIGYFKYIFSLMILYFYLNKIMNAFTFNWVFLHRSTISCKASNSSNVTLLPVDCMTLPHPALCSDLPTFPTTPFTHENIASCKTWRISVCMGFRYLPVLVVDKWKPFSPSKRHILEQVRRKKQNNTNRRDKL